MVSQTAQNPAAPLLLEVRGLTKSFPGVRALQGVSLDLRRGEVLAVIGENGAGKSTLMKILAGVQAPDRGDIRLEGESVRIESVREAERMGIALIHQELNLADNLDVAANVWLGREMQRRGWMDQRGMAEATRSLLGRVGLECEPGTLVGSLSLGCQQLVEIAKALSVHARILIMDEPTSSLSQHEADRLFEVIRELRREGVSIIYISHRLGEVRELADRVVVLRDGRNAGELAAGEVEHDRMVQLMVGREVSQFYQRRQPDLGGPILEVRGLRTAAHPAHPLSFQVRAGEIVGVAGLVGAGRTELLEVLFGIEPARGGEVLLEGRRCLLQHPRDAIEAGVALVPEDRKLQGVILEMAVRTNLSLPGLRRHGRRGLVDRAWEEEAWEGALRRLEIKTPGPEQPVQFLSGGNQQKVVLGKWLALEPRLLLLDEPTRGIDVGAKQEIYRLMEKLAGEGKAVLFVSSEMEEILGMSDRVLVMHEGRIMGELARAELSEEAVMRLATGQEGTRRGGKA